MVLEARLRSLEATIARAKVVDRREIEDGVAVIGSTPLIEDLDSGTLSQYRLGSAHDTLRADTISASSPMGKALVGAPKARSSPSTFLTAAHATCGSRKWRHPAQREAGHEPPLDCGSTEREGQGTGDEVEPDPRSPLRQP